MNDVMKAIRAGRWAVIGAVLAGLAIAGALAATAVRTYVSTTELFVSVSGASDASSAYQGSLFTQERIDTYARLLTTAPLAQQVVEDLGVPLTADQILGKVTAVPLPDTDVLQVTVTDTSAARAQAIADSLGRQFALRVAELEASEGTVGATITVDAIEPATFEPTPISPSVPRYLLLGAVVGLLIGLALALLRTRFDSAVRSTADVQTAVGAVPVTRLYEDRQLLQAPFVAELTRPSPTTRALRTLRLALEHSGGPGDHRVLVVTSAAPGEGKSTVAVGLAVALSEAGSRVVLVDGNTWRPRASRYLGLGSPMRGLTDVLAGRAELREVLLPAGGSRLSLLPSGPMPDDPGRLFESVEMRAVVDTLRAAHDYVVIDAPALLPLVDAAALGALADGCLLVTEHGKTRRDELAEAVTAVAAIDSRVLGVVLNRVPRAAAAPAERRRYRPDPDRQQTGPAATRPPAVGQPPARGHENPDTLPAASRNS